MFTRKLPFSSHTHLSVGIGPKKLTLKQFGHGSRVCMGRHVAILEITKVIVAILRDFHFELACSDEEWQITTYNVPKPKSINVWIYRRGENDCSDKLNTQ